MSVQDRIRTLVEQNDVVLFMKGNRMFPQCGFSARAVEILRHAGVTRFESVDVLADAEIRQGQEDYAKRLRREQIYRDLDLD
jgi:monothiol glutaredoxin